MTLWRLRLVVAGVSAAVVVGGYAVSLRIFDSNRRVNFNNQVRTYGDSVTGLLNSYEHILAGGGVHFLEEPPGIQPHLKALTVGARARRDFWTDAYLAAFAQSAGMRMVTFDAGFSRFKDFAVWVLDPSIV